MDKLLTVEEVAEYLHISPESVRRYLRDGEMGGVKLAKKWLVREKDLEKFIQSHSTDQLEKEDRGN